MAYIGIAFYVMYFVYFSGANGASEHVEYLMKLILKISQQTENDSKILEIMRNSLFVLVLQILVSIFVLFMVDSSLVYMKAPTFLESGLNVDKIIDDNQMQVLQLSKYFAIASVCNSIIQLTIPFIDLFSESHWVGVLFYSVQWVYIVVELLMMSKKGNYDFQFVMVGYYLITGLMSACLFSCYYKK